MGLFDGYFDPQTFDASGGLLGRLLSLQRQQGIPPDSEFDPQSASLQTPQFAPMPSLGSGRASPEQNLQYVAPRSVIDDRNAMAPAAGPQLRQALTNQQRLGDISTSTATSAITNALADFYHQTIQQEGKDIAGYAHDAINDPGAFSRAIGPSFAALGPIAGELPAIIRGAVGAVGALGPAPRPNLGDLTPSEVQQIQSVVNQAGRPLEVVGSAARGARRATSDIDYLVPPSSLRYYEGLQGRLPGIDPEHGIVPGVGNPEIGPAIRFEPK
jgi:hypothetical protein